MEKTVPADVILQAQLARDLADELCAPTGCAWYHGVWPSLRALGLVATPYRHRELFDGVLRRATAAGRGDVLVSGAADAAMVELVVEAYAGSGTVPTITVLDRCATPVRVAVDAMAGVGVVVDPWVAEVLDADRDGAFDVICTHGLLPLQPADVRPRVVRRWAELLRPGGVAVTTSSIAEPDAADPQRYAPDAVEAFASRAVEAYRAAEDEVVAQLPFGGADELADAARAWATRAIVHPVRDPSELGSAFEGAGFDVTIEIRTVDGPLSRGASGPWSARSMRYAEVVATRR